MEDKKDPILNPEDALKAENTFLKMKLGLEHGMEMNEISTLPPDVENKWLKSVYAFEQQYKDAKRTTVYDYIGKPEYRKWDTLSSEEVVRELDRVELILAKHNLELDCICEYDKALIYKFITEELFHHEIDDMRIPDMVYHFIYEEFHPNHEYDVRQDSGYFINSLFTRAWDPEFDRYKLANKVSFSGVEYDHAGIAAIIRTFQEAHRSFDIEKFEVSKVAIDHKLVHAEASGILSWSGKMKHGEKVQHEGACVFRFVREHESWSIVEFGIPGFSKKE